MICYFLFANDIKFQYEPPMNLDGEVRPDFVLEDNKGNYVILEHFGLNNYEYIRKKKNFAYIKLRKSKVKIVVMLPISEGKKIIKKNVIKDVSQPIKDYYGGECFDIYIENGENIPEVITLLTKAYDYNK